jgi:hypothetical protein
MTQPVLDQKTMFYVKKCKAPFSRRFKLDQIFPSTGASSAPYRRIRVEFIIAGRSQASQFKYAFGASLTSPPVFNKPRKGNVLAKLSR